jgi:hypothetical protein
MPSADWRRSRTVNVHDELWNRIHRGYLAAAQASAEHVSKSEFLEEVFEAGLAAVAARLGVTAAAPPPPRPHVSTAPGQAQSTTPPPRRRATPDERRAAAMERLRGMAGEPLHPPAIDSAARRLEDGTTDAVVPEEHAS